MNSYPGPYGQVLTNLFLNAVAHAFPDGKGGTIRDQGAGRPGMTMSKFCFPTMAAAVSGAVRRQAFDPFFTTRRDQGTPALACTSSTASSRIAWVAGSISTADPGEGTKIRIIMPRVGTGGPWPQCSVWSDWYGLR